MTSNLTKDSLATILICSNLGIDIKNENSPKSYTINQWNKLTEKLINSSMKRPKEFFTTTKEEWRKELYLNNEEVDRIEKLLSRSGQIGIEIEKLESLGIFITTRAEKNYPKNLKNILKKNSPPILYYAGDLELLETEGVAIVGSRKIDEEAFDFTRKLSQKCVKEKLTIVSGGAKGIDDIAQNSSLEMDGKVISVLSDSLAKKIKKKEVREAIIDKKLLLISAVNPNASFTVYSAMERNKYIYGLSNYAVAVSSDDGKGGTWAGASENLKYKWVPLFVRNEENVPKGNKKLIDIGAIEITREAINDEIKLIDYFEKSIKKEITKENIKEYTFFDNLIDSSVNNKHNVFENTTTSTFVKEEDKSEYRKNKDLDTDLYNIVWPHIEKLISIPRTSKELCGLLKVRKVQLDDWIDRGIQDNKIKKLENPVKYTLLK